MGSRKDKWLTSQTLSEVGQGEGGAHADTEGRSCQPNGIQQKHRGEIYKSEADQFLPVVTEAAGKDV